MEEQLRKGMEEEKKKKKKEEATPCDLREDGILSRDNNLWKNFRKKKREKSVRCTKYGGDWRVRWKTPGRAGEGLYSIPNHLLPQPHSLFPPFLPHGRRRRRHGELLNMCTNAVSAAVTFRSENGGDEEKPSVVFPQEHLRCLCLSRSPLRCSKLCAFFSIPTEG